MMRTVALLLLCFFQWAAPSHQLAVNGGKNRRWGVPSTNDWRCRARPPIASTKRTAKKSLPEEESERPGRAGPWHRWRRRRRKRRRRLLTEDREEHGDDDSDVSLLSNSGHLPMAPELPGFPKRRLVGLMGNFRTNAIDVIEAHANYCYERALPGVGLDVGVMGTFFLLVGPDQVQYVLDDRRNVMYKSALDRRGVGLLTGNGVLLTDGDDHTKKRRLILPSFDSASLSTFVDVMVDAANEEAKALLSMHEATEADGGSSRKLHVFDAMDRMQSLAMKIVGLCLFSTDCSSGSELGPDIQTCLNHVIYVSRHPFAMPQFVPTRRNRRFKRALRTLDNLVSELIVEGRRKMETAEQQTPDLLAFLLSARYEDDVEGKKFGERQEGASAGKKRTTLTDKELRDEIMTLFLAGHETSAIALSWALWFLADPRHMGWQERIAKEGERLRSEGATPSMLMDPNALACTRAVLCEALRLRGPSWAFDREVQADVELPGGVAFKKGDIVLLSPHVMHRRSEYFGADAEDFDPDRFLGKPFEGDMWDGPFSRSNYLPFGAGRKRCIGFRFAQWEMLIVLSTIMRDVAVKRVPGEEFRHMVGVPGVTLRPEQPCHLVVSKRG